MQRFLLLNRKLRFVSLKGSYTKATFVSECPGAIRACALRAQGPAPQDRRHSASWGHTRCEVRVSMDCLLFLNELSSVSVQVSLGGQRKRNRLVPPTGGPRLFHNYIFMEFPGSTSSSS